MAEYYVIRNKSTGMYFRGKGANRWGQYHNQASVYRMKGQVENTFRWLTLRGEPVEIVPIRIIENATDTVEVVRCKDCIHWEKGDSKGGNSIEDLQWIGGCKWAKCCRREMDFCSCGERRTDG